jgi:hypothetical protein
LTPGDRRRINRDTLYRDTLYRRRAVPPEPSASIAAPGSLAAAASTTGARFAEVLRDIARGGLAGLLAGILVGGIGGRIVMRLATLVSPASVGSFTENGNAIGTISLEGSLAVLIFGGLGAGIVAGVVWVVVSPWIPGRGAVRVVLTAALAVALGGLFLVSAENTDFLVLSGEAAIIGLLLGLIGLIGATVAWLDSRLERRLPPVAGHDGAVIGYGVVSVLGLLIVPGAIGFYTTANGCGCAAPPVWTAAALLLVGGALLAWWWIRISTGRSTMPAALAWTGRAGVIVAAATGLAHLVPEVAAILAAS